MATVWRVADAHTATRAPPIPQCACSRRAPHTGRGCRSRRDGRRRRVGRHRRALQCLGPLRCAFEPRHRAAPAWLQSPSRRPNNKQSPRRRGAWQASLPPAARSCSLAPLQRTCHGATSGTASCWCVHVAGRHRAGAGDAAHTVSPSLSRDFPSFNHRRLEFWTCWCCSSSSSASPPLSFATRCEPWHARARSRGRDIGTHRTLHVGALCAAARSRYPTMPTPTGKSCMRWPPRT